MTRQHAVRALVPRHRVDAVLSVLRRDAGIDREAVDVSTPDPAVYRDEGPNLELRSMVRTGRIRVLVGAVGGGVLGAIVALAVPALQEFAPVSVLLLAFGFAWGAGAVMAARAVQVSRDEGPRGEQLHRVDPGDRSELRLLTVRVQRDRNRVVDALVGTGAALLDSDHPRVGRRAPGQRPADRGADDAGPPAT